MSSQSVALQQAEDDKSSVANYDTAVAGINDTAPRTAQAQLDGAQIAVQQAQTNLDKAKIVAPFDGVVSAVNFNVGDSTRGNAAGASASAKNSSGTGASGSGPAVSIVNLSNLQINVTIAEVDLPKIKVGETTQVTFDALPGNTYHATVKEIGPAGTITQGVVNNPATVALTDADQAEPDVAALLVPTMIIFADADSVQPTHILEFYGLLGGGKRAPAWTAPGDQYISWLLCQALRIMT